MLNPGDIGGESQNGKKKEVAKPFTKMQTKVGQKFVPKAKENK